MAADSQPCYGQISATSDIHMDFIWPKLLCNDPKCPKDALALIIHQVVKSNRFCFYNYNVMKFSLSEAKVGQLSLWWATAAR